MLNTTVCILSYNRAIYLRETVTSVLTQSRQPSKIVIFDNGSRPDVYAAVADYVQQGVKWVGSEVNHGVQWNAERAVHSIDTQYFMLLHDDDRLCPSFLEKQVDFMNANLAVSAVSCNGYFIDELGARTGETLSVTAGDGFYEIYDCSGLVALKYAKNSCVPLSPTLYRTSMSRSVPFRQEFGKVMDAVYFCDLAEVGPVACLMDPLYESRLHGGQDSSHFSVELSNKLEAFFETRKLNNESQRNLLRSLLVRQHTARNLKLIFFNLRHRDFSSVLRLAMEKKFDCLVATTLIWQWTKRIIYARKFNLSSRTVQ